MIDTTPLRADLPVTSACTYLNHAAVGPVPISVADAAAQAGRLQGHDPAHMNQILAKRMQTAREHAAHLWGAAPDRVAFIQNTSHGLSLIANGIDWQDGDQIVVSSQEFPSNFLPWLRQQSRGAKITDFPLVDGRLTPESLAEVITPRTRLVALSHVQFYNGFRADIAGLARVARANGAFLTVDGTQSIGAMEFDLDGWGADALVFSAHKWMLCPKGIGMMLLSQRMLDALDVTVAGWQSVNDRFAFNRTMDYLTSAAKFESGTENGPGIFAITQRVAQLKALGTNAIAAQIISLTTRLADGLAADGWVVTSPDGANERSGIVTARHPAQDADQIVDRLQNHGIRASARGGALRLSPHVHNTLDEIEQTLQVLRL